MKRRESQRKLPFGNRGQAGAALVAVLVVLFGLVMSSVAFVWFMMQAQVRAGVRYRSAAALSVAETGIYRALSILEGVGPDGSPGRVWRAQAYSEELSGRAMPERFVLTLDDQDDGSIVITSVGEAGDVRRRLRAHVYLSSPALLAGLFAAGIVRLDGPPGTTQILPYLPNTARYPWLHIFARYGVWFSHTTTAVNEPTPGVSVSRGPVAPSVAAMQESSRPTPQPVSLLLAREGALMLGHTMKRMDARQLRAMGVRLSGTVLLSEKFPDAGEIDRRYYQLKAETNTSNATLNRAAGEFFQDLGLAHKQDSLYTPIQFERLQVFLRTSGHALGLSGAVYVAGRVFVAEDTSIMIANGTLVTEGAVHISRGASLEVTHSSQTRAFPGLIVQGELALAEGARLHCHGLLYTNGLLEVGERAHLDVVGSIIANDPGLSFRNRGTTVVQYDTAVLATPALKVSPNTPLVAWVASWVELP